MIYLGRETDGDNEICLGVRFALCIYLVLINSVIVILPLPYFPEENDSKTFEKVNFFQKMRGADCFHTNNVFGGKQNKQRN